MLRDRETMKIIIWTASCGIAGYPIYNLLRFIDYKFNKENKHFFTRSSVQSRVPDS